MVPAAIFRDDGAVALSTAVSVDSVWVKHCKPPKVCSHHVDIVTGRATLADGRSKVYGYVGKRVSSPASRLDHFFFGQGVNSNIPAVAMANKTARTVWALLTCGGEYRVNHVSAATA